MRLIIIVFGTVSCLIGVSFATVNLTCTTTKQCDNASQNEICENGYCKIKIEGACTVDQTPTTAAPPTTAEGSTTTTLTTSAPTTAKNATSPTTLKTNATAPTTNATTNATTPDPSGRKRRDASSSMNTQECVENSLCTKTASSNPLTCQCRDEYTKDENGSCQHKSSASRLRTGFFASVVVALLMFIWL